MRLTVDLIIDNMLPISTVDSRALVQLMTTLEPNYQVSCRQTITARIEQRKRELENQLRQTMTKHAPAVSVTSDI